MVPFFQNPQNDIQAKVEAEVQKARVTLTGLRTGAQAGKPCFFKMAYRSGKSMNLSANGIFCRNFQFEDMEESLAYLKDQIHTFGPSHNPSPEFLVSFVTSEKSNNDHVIVINNPYYMGNPQIAGHGNMHGGHNSMMGMQMGGMQNMMMMMMSMQKQDFSNQLKAQQQQFEQMMKLKEKDDEIAGLAEAKRTSLEKAVDLLESDGVNNLIDRFFFVMQSKKQAAPVNQSQAQPQTQQQVTQEVPQQHSDLTPEQQKVHHGITKLYEKYGEEVPDLIYQMGIMCHEKPGMADMVINQLRTKEAQ